MIDIRRVLHPFIRSIHPRSWFLRAPDDAQFEYLTYSFINVDDDGEGFNIVQLEIDGWDMPANGDTTRLENLMVELDEALNKKTLTSDNLVVSFYLDRKLSLEDDNPKIIRRKHIYQGRLFERGDR